MHKKVDAYYGSRSNKCANKVWHTKTSKKGVKGANVLLFKRLNEYIKTLKTWKDELYALEKDGLIEGYKQITGSFGIIEQKISKLMGQVVNKAVYPNAESKEVYYDDLSNKLSKLDSKKERMRKRDRSLQDIYGIDPVNLKSLKKDGKKNAQEKS